MGDKITGAVARVLSDREVVLNRGEKHGLKVGDYVGIIASGYSSVADPETGRDIGQVLSFKAPLRVTQVSESLAIASTYRVKEVNRGGFGGPGGASAMGGIGRYLQEPKWVEEVERMQTVQDDEQYPDDSKTVVSVGDEFRVVSKSIADTGYTI